MRDYMDFDLTPSDVSCAQVGQENYRSNAILEYRAMKAQLEMLFPEMDKHNVSVSIHSNPHDFGVYYSLRVYYDSDNEMSLDYAIGIENNWPETWSSEALDYLKANEYSVKLD